MKRAAIIIAVLGISVWGFAQSGFAQGNDKPAAQNAPPDRPGQASGQAAAPAGKRPPQAKTQAEFDGVQGGGGVDRSRGAGESGGRFCDEISGQRVAASAL